MWWTCNSIEKEPLHKLMCNGSFLFAETLSVIAARCQIPPFVTYGDIFPRPGEICPLKGELFLHLAVSTKAFPQEIILLNFGIAERLRVFRYPFLRLGS